MNIKTMETLALAKKCYHRIQNYRSKLIFFLSRILFKNCKIKRNKIVIDNFFGKGFGDNEKYIAEALIHISDKPLDIVWIVNKDSWDSSFPSYIRKVKFNSFRQHYELATAKIWIDNIKNFNKGPKKPDQFYLQTWHGAVALKKVEKAAEEMLGEEYVSASKFDSTQIDLFISNSKWFSNDVRNNFWYSGEIIETGMPRNDAFFRNPIPIKEKVRKYFNLRDEVEFILYAPTFRGNDSIEEQRKIYEINERTIIDCFAKKFNKKFIIIKRLHPNVSKFIPVLENTMIKDGSSYPDMQDLLISCFALITDFSSSIFDLMLINDHIFLFAKDYEVFVRKERKLNFDIKKDLPFPFAQNEEELIDNIHSFDEQKTHAEINSFKDYLHIVDDGHASERVAKVILERIEG